MPRFKLYNMAIVNQVGGKKLVERMAAKERGGRSFADGRKYEQMYGIFRILEMADKRFRPHSDLRQVWPYDISECLECLVDDLLIRIGSSVNYFQLKSGGVDKEEREKIRLDFQTQQLLDIRQCRAASYHLIVNGQKMKDSLTVWAAEANVNCNIVSFVKTTGIPAMLAHHQEAEVWLEWLTNSKRQNRWTSFCWQLAGKWGESGDTSIDDLIFDLVNVTRFQSPKPLNDDIRRDALEALLLSYNFTVEREGDTTFCIYADFADQEWSAFVACNDAVLNAFDIWYGERSEVSQGEIMDWFAENAEHEDASH